MLVEGVGNVASDEVELTPETEQERAGLISSNIEIENDQVNEDKEIEAAELKDILILNKLRKSMSRSQYGLKTLSRARMEKAKLDN